MLCTLHLHNALPQLYLNKMGSIKWERNKKAHAQHPRLWTGLSALHRCERCSCLWCAQSSQGLHSQPWMKTQTWVYGDRGGFCLWVHLLFFRLTQPRPHHSICFLHSLPGTCGHLSSYCWWMGITLDFLKQVGRSERVRAIQAGVGLIDKKKKRWKQKN